MVYTNLFMGDISFNINNHSQSQRTKIQPTFLQKPVSEWSDDASFQELGGIVTAFHVVND